MASKIRITLRRGMSGRPQRQRRVLRALGLRKLGRSVELPNHPSVQGMVTRIAHMVDVEILAESDPKS